MPGGFQRLKQDFEKFMPVLEPKKSRLDGNYERSEVLEFLFARALFEIAGNLDTIAAVVRNLEERGK